MGHPWAGFPDSGKPSPKCGSEAGTCSRHGTHGGAVIFRYGTGDRGIPGKRLSFYQRGRRNSSPASSRGKAGPEPSEAEQRHSTHRHLSCRGAASHPAPLSRGCGVSRRIQTSATS